MLYSDYNLPARCPYQICHEQAKLLSIGSIHGLGGARGNAEAPASVLSNHPTGKTGMSSYTNWISNLAVIVCAILGAYFDDQMANFGVFLYLVGGAGFGVFVALFADSVGYVYWNQKVKSPNLAKVSTAAMLIVCLYLGWWIAVTFWLFATVALWVKLLVGENKLDERRRAPGPMARGPEAHQTPEGQPFLLQQK